MHPVSSALERFFWQRPSHQGTRRPLRRLRLDPLEERQMLFAAPALLVDLDSTPVLHPAEQHEVVALGETVLFVARDLAGVAVSAHGYELWASDSAGTRLVKDIRPGQLSSDPRKLVVLNGTAYFIANSTNTFELWRSDGTTEGTQLVKSITGWPGRSVDGDRMARVREGLVFIVGGQHLWRSDGTPEGTIPLAEQFGQLANFTQVGERAYFTRNKNEVWVTDGTPPGTQIVMAWGYTSPRFGRFMGSDGVDYFLGYDPSNRWHIWTTNGTDAGTRRLDDLGPLLDGYPLARLLGSADGFVYFSANGELWRADSTGAAELVKTQSAANHQWEPFADEATAVLGNRLVYKLNDDDLWITDGTDSGTLRLADGGVGREFLVVDNVLYFDRADVEHGRELWRTDGTVSGTVLFADVVSGSRGSHPLSLTQAGGSIFFQAYDVGGEVELWRTEITTASAIQVSEIADVPGTPSSKPKDFTQVADKVIFHTDEGLWVTDGTESGTKLVKTFASFFDPYAHGNVDLTVAAREPTFKVVGGRVYFVADDGVHGYELWTSDGSAEGTHRITEIAPGALYNPTAVPDVPRELTLVGDDIYFATAVTLWKTDGTEQGTQPVKVFDAAFRPVHLIEHEGMLFFSLLLTDSWTVWKSDGTEEGTTLVATLPALTQPPQVPPGPFISFDGRLFFRAETEDRGTELWISDGSPSGTHLLADIHLGGWEASSSPAQFTVFEGRLYFTAYHAHYSRQLWTTDGTPEGTVMVSAIPSSPDGIHPHFELVVADDAIYFSPYWIGWAYQPSIPYAVWKSDGVSGRSEQIVASNTGGRVQAAFGNTVLFTRDVTNGGVTEQAELWRTDGTGAGTQLVAAFRSLSGITAVGNRAYFTADDGKHGEEPWIYDVEIDAPWQNSAEPLDVSGDGRIDARDCLIIINWLNEFELRTLPARPAEETSNFLDVNGDNHVTPLDALLVIDWLNDRAGAATLSASSPAVSASAVSSEATSSAEDWSAPSDLSTLGPIFLLETVGPLDVPAVRPADDVGVLGGSRPHSAKSVNSRAEQQQPLRSGLPQVSASSGKSLVTRDAVMADAAFATQLTAELLHEWLSVADRQAMGEVG